MTYCLLLAIAGCTKHNLSHRSYGPKVDIVYSGGVVAATAPNADRDARSLLKGPERTVTSCVEGPYEGEWQDIAAFTADDRMGTRVRVGGQVDGMGKVRALASFCSSHRLTVLTSLRQPQFDCAPLEALVVVEGTVAEATLIESATSSDVESYVLRDVEVLGRARPSDFCSIRSRAQHAKPVMAPLLNAGH